MTLGDQHDMASLRRVLNDDENDLGHLGIEG